MFADPYLAPKNVASGSAATQAFSLVSNNGTATTRVNTGSYTAGDPKVLKISHSVVGKGANARDRHLVRLEAYPVINSVEVKETPIAFYAVFDIPQVGPTSTQITSMWRQFVGMLRGSSGDVVYDASQSSFLDKVLRGEG